MEPEHKVFISSLLKHYQQKMVNSHNEHSPKSVASSMGTINLDIPRD